jgi:DNA polymerase III sliding clamp (beta) subunit (PCNA family)
MQFGDNHIIMSKGEVKCLLGHTSKDAARVNLYGVIVDLGAKKVWATDGHRAVMACAPGGVTSEKGVSPVMVPRSLVEQCAKHAGCKITLDTETGLGQVKWDGYDRKSFEALTGSGPATPPTASGSAALVQAVPPPIHMVMKGPAEAPCGEAGFNAAYLADLSLLSAADVTSVRFRMGETSLDPCLVRGTAYVDSGAAEWTIVVMPMRI